MEGGIPHHNTSRVTAEKLTESGLDDAQVFMILGDLIIPVPMDRETVIGRNNSACDIVIADPRVSKMHASMYYSGGRFFIKDLGSLNGITVNNDRVRDSQALVNGDTITLPPYTMVFANTQHPRILQMQQARAATPPPNKSGTHFAGQLNILSITDLIQLLNTTKQSGILTIRYHGNESASVFFHTGEILQARYQNSFGEEGVYQVLGLTEGEFEFVRCAPPVPANPVRKPTLTLLLDGCRILDETLGGVRPPLGDSNANTLLFDNTARPVLENARSS